MSDRLLASRDLLESLVDEDDCWFDHHGGCQAHGYLSLQPGELCPQRELKDLLAAHDAAWAPTRWWRVLDEHGELWCETSNPDEAKRAHRPGYRIQHLWSVVDHAEFDWRDEQP